MERNLQNIEKIISGREEEPYGISVITFSELLHGVHRADSEKRRLEREAFVERVIGAHDLMIGATSISLGFSVLTSDVRDFERIPGLKIEKFAP